MIRWWYWARLRWLAFAGERGRPPSGVIALSVAAWGAMLPHLLGTPAVWARRTPAFWSEWFAWSLMVVAMMLPLQGPAIVEVERTTFRTKRVWAVAAYLVGSLLPWLAAGALVSAFRSQVGRTAAFSSAIAFAMAACWCLTPWHLYALQSCHPRRPFAPSGLAMLRDGVIQGQINGRSCLVSCGPLMIACTVTGHSLVAMVGCLLIGWLERSTYRPSYRLAAGLTMGLATWFAVSTALFGPRVQCH